MKAKVTKPFAGRPDGEAATRTIAKDEVIEGELATVAVDQGWAKAIDDRAAAKAEAEADRKAKKRGDGGEGGEGDEA